MSSVMKKMEETGRDDGVGQRVTSPLKRTGHISVTYGRCILVWGGYREYNSIPATRYLPTNEMWYYDTLIEKWSREKTEGPSPAGTSGACAIRVRNKLYIFGGYCEERIVPTGNTNEIYVLNLQTRKWTHLECHGKKPIPCDKMVGWSYNNLLYLFGGFGLSPEDIPNVNRNDLDFSPDETFGPSPRGWNNQLVAFDPVSCEWHWPTYQGTKPCPRAAHAGTLLGDRFYIFGGRHQNERMNDLQFLDMTTFTWSGKLPTGDIVPIGRSWHSLTSVSDYWLVLYGGLSQEQEALSDCWIYDIKELHWTPVALPFNKPRLWHTASLANYGEVFIIGGCIENIFIHTAKHADELIILSFSPKSLLRLCIDSIISNSDILEDCWQNLPNSLQELLRLRSGKPNH